jgi:hypothetical protein
MAAFRYRERMRSVLFAIVLVACAPAPAPTSTPPPTALAAPRELAGWNLSPRYAKHVSVHGFPILSTANVSDAALREAAYLVEQMVGHRPEILQKLADNHVRFVVMATTELTTDVPEHADLVPKEYWDRRARGLGATPERPAVSCGEENLLDLAGDPYATENILVHEFAHAVHQMGVAYLDATFDQRLQHAYNDARAAGRWANTYAMDNHYEYWAEGAQSWFDTNRINDDQHGPIATRAQLVAYDPPLAALLLEVFGDRPWRYQKPRARDAAGRAHLAGWSSATAPTFAWPAHLANVNIHTPPAAQPLVGATLLALTAQAIARSPAGSAPATQLEVVNYRARDIVVEWIDFQGALVPYATLVPGASLVQSTYVGHAWRIRDGATVLGYASAIAGTARLDVR